MSCLGGLAKRPDSNQPTASPTHPVPRSWLVSYLKRIGRHDVTTEIAQASTWSMNPVAHYIGEDDKDFNNEFRLYRQGQFSKENMTRMCLRILLASFVPWLIILIMVDSRLYTNVSSVVKQFLMMGRAFMLMAMIIPWAAIFVSRQVWYLKYTKFVHRMRVTTNIEVSVLSCTASVRLG